MIQAKQASFYKVICVDGSSMGHTSSKPELLEALEMALETGIIDDTDILSKVTAAIANAKGA